MLIKFTTAPVGAMWAQPCSDTRVSCEYNASACGCDYWSAHLYIDRKSVPILLYMGPLKSGASEAADNAAELVNAELQRDWDEWSGYRKQPKGVVDDTVAV
jgi:hypothetical protein